MFISHKLGEVLSIADRITVMRAGRVTAAGIDPKGVTRADLARLMVGRPVLEQLKRTDVEPGRVVLQVEDVRADNDRGRAGRSAARRSRSVPARSSASRRSQAMASPSSPRSSPVCGRAPGE